MKRIYMTLSLVALASVGAFAQGKEADLSIRMLSPMTDATYDNFNNPPAAASDTLLLAWEITNAGAGDLTTSDTLRIGIGLAFLGLSDDPNEAIPLGSPDGYELPAGTTDTLFFRVWQGFDFGLGPVTLPSNTVASTFAYVIAIDENGDLFTDPGVDPGAGTIGGNNFAVAENITIGTPAGIFDPIANTSLSVYPNPVENGVLNIQYELKASAAATVNVMDIMGRVLTSENIDAKAGLQTHAVNVANLPAGNYIVEISSTEGRGVSKFTIK